MSDSDTDDELRAELQALRKALGNAYRVVRCLTPTPLVSQ